MAHGAAAACGAVYRIYRVEHNYRILDARGFRFLVMQTKGSLSACNVKLIMGFQEAHFLIPNDAEMSLGFQIRG